MINIKDFLRICEMSPNPSNTEILDLTYRDYKKAHVEIRKHLGNNINLVHASLLLLRKNLAIWSIKNRVDATQYLRIFNCLFESARIDTKEEVFQDEADWDKAVATILTYKGSFSSFGRETKEQFDDKTYEFALSYVNLKKFGILFHEIDHEIHILEDSHKLIDNTIENYCKRIGGKNLLSTLFNLLSVEYRSAPGRFLSLRKLVINQQSRVAEVPYGYLLAIGARHIGDKGTEDHKEHFISLVLFCRDLTTIFEIQPYSYWETMFIPPEKFIRFLQETVWHDNLISFSQIKAQHAKRIMTRLSKKYVEQRLISKNSRLKDILRTALALTDLAKDKFSIGLSNSDIAAKAGLHVYIVKKIMEDFLSFRPDKVNTTLAFPPISNDIDYYFKPAIQLDNTYYIYPRSICALGALNSVLHTISFPDGKQDFSNESALGYELEDLLREEFQAKGFKISYGEGQNISDVNGFECDLLLETSKSIIIFEIKKKALTRKAMSGDEVSLLTDLSDSLMFSHMQAMRIERHLQDNDSVDLTHKGEIRTIKLNGRRTKRVSVSLNDFGALQDKIGLQIILRHATDTTLNHPDDKIDKKLQDWRSYTSEIRRFAELNNEYDPNSGMPFYNSFFMSIPQILTMLSDSQNHEDFDSYISLMGSMTYGTRNFYREYYYGKATREGAAKELARMENAEIQH